MIDQEPFYDLSDVSRKLGNCSRSTLYRLIEQNKLVRVRLGGKALITGESLAGYVEELMATPVLAHDSKLERAKTIGDSRGQSSRQIKRKLLPR